MNLNEILKHLKSIERCTDCGCRIDLVQTMSGYTCKSCGAKQDKKIMESKTTSSLEVKIKLLLPSSRIPKYTQEGDAAMDLVATSKEVIGKQIKYGTGLAFEIPEGYVGLIYPRSSIVKTSLRLGNSVGVIDSNYRGEVTFMFDHNGGISYNIGDRIGQIMIVPYPKIYLTVVDELSITNRNDGAYGSTGR